MKLPPSPYLVAGLFLILLAGVAYAWSPQQASATEGLSKFIGRDVQVVLVRHFEADPYTITKGALVHYDRTGITLQAGNGSTWVPFSSMKSIAVME